MLRSALVQDFSFLKTTARAQLAKHIGAFCLKNLLFDLDLLFEVVHYTDALLGREQYQRTAANIMPDSGESPFEPLDIQ